MQKAFQIQVFGKVQGVYYRQSTRDKALELGLKGTVQNLPDGSVLIHAEGNEENLNKLISWCHKGPIMSNVEQVKFSETEFKNLSTFEIIR
ncbi:MAG: acylphosphatase [Bacteroidia bacterium]|nr:MAG: acylphosphatase [Bacteroidia bacterium]